MNNASMVNDTAELVKKYHQVEILEISDEHKVIVKPDGKEIKSLKSYLDEYRMHPERRKGTAVFTTVESFIEHANRFKNEHSAIFADNKRENPSLTSVLNYHDNGAEGTPRFGDHRGHFAFPLSDEWKVWQANDGRKMNQKEFAEFLEDRINDTIAVENLSQETEAIKNFAELIGGNFASPSKLVEIGHGLAVREGKNIKQIVNLSSGEISVVYHVEHNDDNGKPITVPNLFMIAIPVFCMGSFYKMAVRLRYRMNNEAISWFYNLYRTDKVFDHAFDEACRETAEKTGLPLFFGKSE